MHRALLFLALVGCYSPTYSEGLLCAPGPDPCPPGQSCFSGTCYLSSRDGAPDDSSIDADIDSGPCPTGTFCLETTPALGNLTGVWGPSADRIWVTSDQGVWSYNQGTWTAEPLTGTFVAVHGVANNAVWVVTNNGEIKFWNGTTWSPMMTVTSGLRAVHAISSTEAWATGGANRAWHLNSGATWVLMSSGMIGTPYALAARDSSELYAGGDDSGTVTPNATLHRFQGASWTRVTISPAIPMTFRAMWYSLNQLFIVGGDTDSGEIFAYDGVSVLSEKLSNVPLHAIDGVTDTDVWAAGAGGTVFRRLPGGNWIQVLGTGFATLRGIAAFSNKVWVVGDNARVFSLSR